VRQCGVIAAIPSGRLAPPLDRDCLGQLPRRPQQPHIAYNWRVTWARDVTTEGVLECGAFGLSRCR
jgi:hypothetical protein